MIQKHSKFKKIVKISNLFIKVSIHCRLNFFYKCGSSDTSHCFQRYCRRRIALCISSIASWNLRNLQPFLITKSVSAIRNERRRESRHYYNVVLSTQKNIIISMCENVSWNLYHQHFSCNGVVWVWFLMFFIFRSNFW